MMLFMCIPMLLRRRADSNDESVSHEEILELRRENAALKERVAPDARTERG
jgi:hypothetical protein